MYWRDVHIGLLLASQSVFVEFGEVPGGHGWQDPHAVFTSFA